MIWIMTCDVTRTNNTVLKNGKSTSICSAPIADLVLYTSPFYVPIFRLTRNSTNIDSLMMQREMECSQAAAPTTSKRVMC